MDTARRVEVRVTASGVPPHDPLELYERLRAETGDRNVFLLESSGDTGAEGRGAVVGVNPVAEIRVFARHVEIDGAPGVVAALSRAAEETGAVPEGAPSGTVRLPLRDREEIWRLLPAAQGVFAVDTDVPVTEHAFGFLASLAYEAVWHVESLPGRDDPGRGPDMVLALFRDTVGYDPDTGSARLLTAQSPLFGARQVTPRRVAELAACAAEAAPAPVPGAPEPLGVQDTVSRGTFLGWAERCLEHIRVGDVYQIQIGHRIDVRTALSPLDLYRRLRARNPSPYMYLAPRAGSLLIGASPELFVRVEGDGIEMRPIAGTARRGLDEAENERRVKEMQESAKERAEHIMLVDLCRNDIGRVCRPGTLPVDRLMAVERFSHVFHLVSTVTGRLARDADTWDAVRATFPAGTMSGAPKVRAMEIIDGLEQERRGSYAGAVGLLDVRGRAELALCIRSVEYDGDTYSTQSSAGMVAQSDPESEWRETLAKMGAAYWALTGKELQA
ncbi:anthranilate synthase component I family protein [Streptomyces sp. NPDC102451]|uniref:anthranilate synthase component I family protein n=1 Tax=Streptomyces sp. NPDC102451 TaxID=3366177 RepID=UPI00382D8F98